MTQMLYIDCCGDTKNVSAYNSAQLVGMLEAKGYRYDLSYGGGKITVRKKSAHNMPYITIDVNRGFFWGSKGGDYAVDWQKLTSRVRTMLASLPDINGIHDRARKSDGAVDRHMRQPSKDGRKMERFWVTNTGHRMPISAIKDDHLHNTILMVDRNIAAGCSRIGGNEDLANMLDELEDERIHRGLHLPLVPLISLEYRKGKI